jgi:hypothetical protein
MDTKLVGLVRLHLASLARIADIFVTCNRLFRLTVRLRRSRLLTQLYVGKRPISKRDRDSIRKFVVPAFGARSWNVDVGFRATRRTAECFATHRPLGRYSNRDCGRIERESDCLHGKIRDHSRQQASRSLAVSFANVMTLNRSRSGEDRASREFAVATYETCDKSRSVCNVGSG